MEYKDFIGFLSQEESKSHNRLANKACAYKYSRKEEKKRKKVDGACTLSNTVTEFRCQFL